MGNIKSHLKHKRPSIKKIPEFDQIESDKERNEKLIDYYLSTSIDSIDRLHIYHFLRAYIFQSRFSSPVEDKLIEGGCKVLDVGCGAATWLLDLSNKYENSYFYGVDIKPIYPQEIKPNNLEFIEADVTNRLSFHDNEFDFTHLENMSFVFTPDQWDFILSELVRVTKPGGYIEISDRRNGYIGEGPIFRKLTDAIWSTYSKRNIDVKLVYKLDSKFELQPNIGKVHRIEKDLIIGPNGDKIGLVFQDLTFSYHKSELSIKVLSEEMGISEEEYKNMVENLVEEFKQTSTESVHVRFWTQKQLSE
ncbi:uncharacterized protein OCT59_015901 [Rhizophagus irregularis]|uniref:Methyltransferase domain-containing protein n=2 Tax=Rhizophagus irregularis TaxID=588596 RepID=A0A015JAG8_RHIIW|nr:umta methyltransferase family protein [Rhizophagus irregularis DAOM 181602=DAOM 197198]EXX63880.1 hypothetical protein RirG_148180 [Rhizophagus irregularis DAOM 197198w]UZO23568.1 hypothetical protein OCT59_015901 [Rhizophagus irregularis]POG62330.1 umta methyltransferase family protein [Rhizophagus irregularis DAOM 181602=DAOM 197198]CAG8695735.1 16556_t:CDS:2 [Rhizophagus irregularis]GBC30752.1 S-adenosyl-L-methionine-dependent methyltransferase [Rhizophagus irregularis DAOM 181602=DAOM 1|eukprot:XP_025169196.1 umta methyltransferase family protein [Rhizophagus irregularis DAOM 181602=DAOM 197198]